MRKSLSYIKIISFALLILFSSSVYWIFSTQAQIVNLKIESSTTLLKAGFNNNITLTIYNDFENIYDLNIFISFPTSLQTFNTPTIIGLNHWKFDKVAKGGRVEIQVVIFAPDNSAGNAYAANLALTYKRLGYISAYTEAHTLGFYVKGWVEIVLYDLTIDPNPAYPGSIISFTVNILNKGNIPASFTNASLLKNDVLLLTSESFSYLGEIDSASSTPFTLEAIVNPEAYEGNYTATIVISYEDKEHILHTINYQIQFNIIKFSETQGSTKNTYKYIVDYLLQHWFFITLIILAVLIVSYAIFKLKSKASVKQL
ncbi:MAG: CARDB domain-containing protein [Candidatus Bathyarchaeia archaeon]